MVGPHGRRRRWKHPLADDPDFHRRGRLELGFGAGNDAAALAGAHVVSALAVVMTEGHKRHAVNMLWEWTALAVQFTLVRQTFRYPFLRQRYVHLLLIFVACLAAYGVWQHYYWYPASVRFYEQRRAELDELAARIEDNSAGQEERKRAGQLRAEFHQQGVPLDQPQRGLFEKRLRDSREPLGFFALANSFAALILVGVALATGAFATALRHWKSGDEESDPDSVAFPLFLVSTGLLLLLAYCLLLTKSRTAWGGTVVALAVFAVAALLRRRRAKYSTPVLLTILSGVTVPAVLIGIAFATRALDAEVLTEAPKSLQYRFEYWTGSWRVFADHPVLGTGPGNFRNHYLRHKLPQSSEEISDPHQMFLDVAANAGTPALIALFAVLLLGAMRLLKSKEGEAETETSASDAHLHSDSVAALLSVMVVTGWVWLTESRMAWPVVVTGGGAVGILWYLNRRVSYRILLQPAWCHVALLAAFAGLVVHLQAAGGIAMPAIVGLFLSLIALGSETGPEIRAEEEATGSRRPVRSWIVSSTACLLFSAAILPSAFLPVTEARGLLLGGDYSVGVNGDVTRARRLYQLAAETDPLSPEPSFRLSNLAFRTLQSGGSNSAFDQAVEFGEMAADLDPDSPQVHIHLARVFEWQAPHDGNENHLNHSVERYEAALERYPTQPHWLGEYATDLNLCGRNDDARRAARRALELDNLNRAAGHIDRFLDAEIRKEVEKLAGRQEPGGHRG